ncbi:hemicentin-1-like [Copidosoma floridanum]|uniref:hemicentin-1-like n=1 Tax=Copidosoma floridanum TaxID=29053 RepID=UPI000C6F742F|nr:hemicentin-1-like [Copidosoma floridanum]
METKEKKIEPCLPEGKVSFKGRQIVDIDILARSSIEAKIGFRGLNRLLAYLNIPSIDHKLYARYLTSVRAAITKVAEESCAEARQEERRLVIQNMKDLRMEFPEEVTKEIYPEMMAAIEEEEKGSITRFDAHNLDFIEELILDTGPTSFDDEILNLLNLELTADHLAESLLEDKRLEFLRKKDKGRNYKQYASFLIEANRDKISYFLIMDVNSKFLGCHGLKPQLYPNVTELEINEGEPLNITCTSNSYVNFYFPTSDERGRTTSQPLITPEIRSTHKTFIRLSTVFGDTGWYGCADESKQITSLTYKNYSDLSISWVYVYVFGLSEKITFDSKTGFVIKEANWGTDSTSRKIINTVRVEEKGFYNLVNLITSELIINNVTHDNRGNYTCKIRSSFDEEESLDTHVCVFDTNKPYINLTSDNLNIHSDDGKSVTFLALVDACPIPTLKWTHPGGYTIHPYWRNLRMSNYGTMSKLTLLNIDKDDTGFFTLTAKHDKIEKDLKFYLDVYGKPTVRFDKTYLTSYYSFNKTAKFVCLVDRHPKSNISWTKINYWTKTETLDLTEHNLQGIETDVQNSNFKQKSTVELKQLVTSGVITCTACNSYGCASTSKEIRIADKVNKPYFGIVQPNRSFHKGDNISLICAVLTHSFSKVVWYDENGQVVHTSERINVTTKVTRFIYQAILTINNASVSDRKNYYCKRIERYNRFVGYPSRKIPTKSYFLNINDPPSFTLVNMNATKRTVMAKDFENPLTLLCHVGGIPTPKITWSKNNVPLKMSSQYTFEDNNQKLTIRYFFEKDSGNYSCHAKNDYGTVEKSQIIVVKGNKNHCQQ